MSTITVLTLVPNAGDRLPRCLESVQWADDIFCVVDPATTDGSDEVARRYTSHVVTHEFINHAAQENWALEQIQTEWTLILDADEWVTEELASRIRQIIRDPASHDLYYIRRLSYFLGRQIRHCGWDRDYNSRLFRTRKGRNTECRTSAHRCGWNGRTHSRTHAPRRLPQFPRVFPDADPVHHLGRAGRLRARSARRRGAFDAAPVLAVLFDVRAAAGLS